jgi:hypothetical protein
VSSSRGLHIIRPMRALGLLSASILVSLTPYFKLKHFIIYVSLLYSRTHVITLYLSHVYDVLYVNASVLITHMDLG